MGIAEGTVLLSPEQQVLARAAVPMSPVPMPGGADWAEVCRMAEWHRLSPLLSRLLLSGQVPDAPDAVVGAMRNAYVISASTNLHLRRELDRVVSALQEAGVGVMVLKGMALLESVYPELGLRPMVDLDVLVAQDRYELAGSTLERAGFVGYQGFRARLDGPSRGPFVNTDRTTTIDLHHRVADDVESFAFRDLQERARFSKRGPYLIPGAEDLLVHLALHFVGHREKSSAGALGQLADMAWVIDGGVDWDQLTRTVEETGTRRRVALALTALANVLGTAVPRTAVEAVRRSNSADREMTNRFIQHRVLDTRTWHHPRYFRRRARGDFDAKGRPFSRLIPSREHMEHRYGEWGEASRPYPMLYLRRLRRAASPMLRGHVITEERLHRWVGTLDRN